MAILGVVPLARVEPRLDLRVDKSRLPATGVGHNRGQRVGIPVVQIDRGGDRCQVRQGLDLAVELEFVK